MTIDYAIQAHPTMYNGVRYRSRLEAKWGAFFDLLHWKFEYEPVDFGTWSPDFAIITHSGPLYVEVKPVTECDPETIAKMGTVPGQHLLVGLFPHMRDDAEVGVSIGWLLDESDRWAPGQCPYGCKCTPTMPAELYWVDTTEVDKVARPDVHHAISHYCGWGLRGMMTSDLISGRDSIRRYIDYGECRIVPRGNMRTDDALRLWKRACNAVQYQVGRRP